ncbi:MAG: sigma-70 family RNA polymerase sigma factor [Pseudomonadota bacterium]
MTSGLTDAALMLRFQEDGDYDAFGELFSRHKDAFVAYLQHLSGSTAIAEDVSQHCWLKLIESVGEGRYRAVAGASFRSYLYTLGRNRYIDEYQRKHAEARRGTMPDLDQVEHPDAAPGDAAEAGERKALLSTALATLPLEQRDVIALWSAGVSIEHMVEITAAPRDTVLSRKKYAMAKLRTAFASMGVHTHDG